LEHHSYYYTTNSAKLYAVGFLSLSHIIISLWADRPRSDSSCPSPHLPEEHQCVTTEPDMEAKQQCNNISQLQRTLDIVSSRGLITCKAFFPLPNIKLHILRLNLQVLNPSILILCVPHLSPTLGLSAVSIWY